MQASDNLFRKAGLAIIVCLLILFGIGTTCLLILKSDWGRTKLLSIATETLRKNGWRCDIGSSEGSLPNTIVLHSVSIYSPSNDVLTIDSLQLELSLLRLLKREINCTTFCADKIRWIPTNTFPLASPAGSGEAMPFALVLSRVRLNDVLLPLFPKQSFDFSGGLKIGRHRQTSFVKLSVQPHNTPKTHGDFFLLVNPDQTTQLKTTVFAHSTDLPFLHLPLQARGNFHGFFSGPWSAFFAILANRETKDSVQGNVTGSIDIESVELSSPLNKPVVGTWTFSSLVERKPDGAVLLSDILASNDMISIKGRADFPAMEKVDNLSLQILCEDSRKIYPEIAGSFSIEARIMEEEQLSLSLVSPHFSSPIGAFDAFSCVLQGEFTKNAWDGSLNLKTMAFGQEWTSHGNLLFERGQSLRIDDFTLETTNDHIQGHLELFPDHLMTGSLKADLKYLHNIFPIRSLYGSIDANIQWDIIDGEQETKVDVQASNLFHRIGGADSASLSASLKGPLSRPAGHMHLDAQGANWGDCVVKEWAFDITGSEGEYLFFSEARGDWRGALECRTHGNLHILPDGLFCDIQDLTGFLLSSPLNLSSPIRIDLSPNLYRLSDMSLSLGNADLRASFECADKKTVGSLLIHRLPLELFSEELFSAGFLDVDVKMSYPSNEEPEATFAMRVSDLKFASGGHQESSVIEGKIEALLAKERLTFDADSQTSFNPFLHVSGDIPLSFDRSSLNMKIPEDRNLAISLRLDGRIEDLLDVFDIGAHRIEGDCQCEFNISGTLSRPEVLGDCLITNGRYENYYTGLQLQNIRAEFLGRGPELQLRSFQAQDSQRKGQLSLHGNIKMSKQDRFPFNFEGDFSRLNITDIEWMHAEAGGEIQIFGDLDSSHIAADVIVLESDISIPERIPVVLPELKVKYLNASGPIGVETPKTATSKSYPIFLDCHVRAPNGIFVSGRGLSSEWKGEFQLGGTYTDIEAKGKLELLLGNFFFSGKDFKLIDGSLTFSGRPHEMPLLNIAAETDIQNLSITAHLRGALNNPRLSFQSVPSLPLGSILAQLLFGHDLSEINALQAAQLIGSLASFSGKGTDFIETSRRSLGVDRLRIIATPTGDEGGETVALQVGKYVTRGILVSVSQGAEESSTNLSVEVDLANGFMFQAESQREQEQGKFTIKWNLNY